MDKKTELFNYLSKCATINRLDKKIEDDESIVASYERLCDEDDNFADLFCGRVNKLNKELLKLKLLRNKLERETLEFEMKIYTEE